VEPRSDWTIYEEPDDFPTPSFTRKPRTDLDTSALPRDRTVFSFHHYDPATLLREGLRSTFKWLPVRPDSMKSKQRDWPGTYRCMLSAAEERKLVPFLTELGADQRWRAILSDLALPTVHSSNLARAYMELQFRQVEEHLLNTAYWNVNFFASERGDDWNYEDFSLFGYQREERNIDIFARPYPMRSAAKPRHIGFDAGTKHGSLVLQGSASSAPTLVFVPAVVHYPSGFRVRASSGTLHWNASAQTLTWQHPPGDQPHVLTVQPPDAPAAPSPRHADLPLDVDVVLGSADRP